MEAEIARLKQDLKVDREIRKVLKKINSKEGSIAETIHQRTEWLQSAGYQIDETEYTEMFVIDVADFFDPSAIFFLHERLCRQPCFHYLHGH